ncbi:MAG: transferrin-binding protein-like solute binding protein [OCS116 cluster bacterium]|nr:transferrin-binding protein-like solute binding protein [OCS116 cluster bacterium]
MLVFTKPFTAKNLIVKTSLIGLAVTSLVASGTTGGSVNAVNPVNGKAFMATINRDAAKSQSTLKSIEIELSQNSGGMLTFVRDGKTYNFTNADLVTGEAYLYQKQFGNITISLQNSSKRDLAPTHNLTTDNVDLWYIGLSNAPENYVERGYAIFGKSTAAMPSDKTVTYHGRVEGYTVNKGSGVQRWVDGASRLTANFKTQTIAGQFDNIRTYDVVNNSVKNESYVVSIQNGKISGNGFSGALSFADNGTDVAVFNNVINGKFYGQAAAEIGATGQIETVDDVITFATVGKQ